MDISQDGKSLEIESDSEPSEVVLVRLGAVTHSSDSDARAIKLPIEPTTQGTIASLPGDGDGSLVPPGAYHVFAMKDTPDGAVPSVAKVVLVRPGADGTVRLG